MDGPAQTAHVVLLHFGRTRVALSGRAVRSLEAATDVVFSGAPSGVHGTIESHGVQWPVYALDEELAPLRDVPHERRTCALLATDHGLFGLLCDEAQVVPRHSVSAHPLPLAMRRPGSPLEGVLNIGEGVAVLSSARALAAVLGVDPKAATSHAPESK
jgi:hypothetical protein